MAVHRVELERLCQEEWEKIPQKGVKLVGSLLRRLAAKGALTKYYMKGLNTDVYL